MPRVCSGGRCYNVPSRGQRAADAGTYYPQRGMPRVSPANLNPMLQQPGQMPNAAMQQLGGSIQPQPNPMQGVMRQPMDVGPLDYLGGQQASGVSPYSANIQSQVVPFPGQSTQQPQQKAPFWPPRGLEWLGGPAYWALKAAAPNQMQGVSDTLASGGQKINEGLFGKDPQHLLFPQFNPEQENILNQLLQMGFGGLAGNQFDFGPIERRARTQFQQQTIPSIAERFTGLGGGQRSSAFQQTLGQAGANLEEGLAAQRSKYNLARFPQLLQLAQTGLAPRYTSALQPGTPGFFGGLAGGAAQGLGSLAPLALLGAL